MSVTELRAVAEACLTYDDASATVEEARLVNSYYDIFNPPTVLALLDVLDAALAFQEVRGGESLDAYSEAGDRFSKSLALFTDPTDPIWAGNGESGVSSAPDSPIIASSGVLAPEVQSSYEPVDVSRIPKETPDA